MVLVVGRKERVNALPTLTDATYRGGSMAANNSTPRQPRNNRNYPFFMFIVAIIAAVVYWSVNVGIPFLRTIDHRIAMAIQ